MLSDTDTARCLLSDSVRGDLLGLRWFERVTDDKVFCRCNRRRFEDLRVCSVLKMKTVTACRRMRDENELSQRRSSRLAVQMSGGDMLW